MEKNPESTAARYAKYAYLGAFFIMLSGLFHPLVSNGDGGAVAIGTGTLIMGLVGGLLVFRASSEGENRTAYLIIGFGLLAVSMLGIFWIAGAI